MFSYVLKEFFSLIETNVLGAGVVMLTSRLQDTAHSTLMYF